MIVGMTPHGRGTSIARYLTCPGAGACVEVATEGLGGTADAHEAVEVLHDLAVGYHTSMPFLHMWARPRGPWTAAERARFWELIEAEFRIEGNPFLSVLHLDRPVEADGTVHGHEHRAWLGLSLDGRAINTSFSAMRAQKIARIVEFEFGKPFTAGRCDRAIINALESNDRHDVAGAMRAAGLHEADRPVAMSAAERAATLRLDDRDADIVWWRIYEAWQRSDCGASLKHALAEEGLTLCQGDRVAGVLTQAGMFHPLRRALDARARITGADPMRAANVKARIRWLELEPMREVMDRLRKERKARAWKAVEGVYLTRVTAEEGLSSDRVLTGSNGHRVGVAVDDASIADPDPVVTAPSVKANEGGTQLGSVNCHPAGSEWNRTKTDDSSDREEVTSQPIAIAPVDWRERAWAVGIDAEGMADALNVTTMMPDDDVQERTVLQNSPIVARPWCVVGVRPTPLAIDLLVAAAREEGWGVVEIVGGTPRTRRLIERKARRAGLMLGDGRPAGTTQTARDAMSVDPGEPDDGHGMIVHQEQRDPPEPPLEDESLFAFSM